MRRVVGLCLALMLAPLAAAAEGGAAQTVTAARAQVGVTVYYDPSYRGLAFPGGDVARDRGVCTDVVIRALRDGWGIDLQLAVNRDMKADFVAYPKTWGLATTDRNIDHRRVPNLQILLTRAGAAVDTGREAEGTAAADAGGDAGGYLPGDLVTWMLPGNLPHIGIVSDARSADGARPLMLHNVGLGAREEDVLFAYAITGHYRIEGEALARLRRLGTP